MSNLDVVNKEAMEYLQQAAAKQGKVKMKVIPWHIQQRYQSGISQISLNHTLTSAQNSKKIKTLLHNNKCLAKALEMCKYELANKENTENIDIISFAGIKLRDVSDNLKKMTICVDETLALLQSHASKQTKKFLYAPACRRDLKQKMRALSGIEKLVEENETQSTNKKNFKKIKESKSSSSNNVQGKNALKSSTFKQKSIKKCEMPVNAKLPKNVSGRDSKPQNESQPSYLLGLSSNLDSFQSKIEEGKTEAVYKVLDKKKPPNSRSDTEQFSLSHSSNVAIKSQKESRPRKRNRPSTKHKETTNNISKSVKNAPCKKAKITFTLQDSSTPSQSSGDGMSSSGGKSYESLEGLSSTSPDTKMDKITSSLQNDDETSDLNRAFTAKESIDSNGAACKNPTDKMHTDLEAEFSLKQPRVVLMKSDMSQSLVKKQSVPLNEVIDGCHGPSTKCAISKKNTGTTSGITKKKVQFFFEKDDDIETLSEAPEPLKKLPVKKAQKRPQKNTQYLSSVSKKQALTFGEALENADAINKNTFVVTAEVHKPPDGYIPEKTQGLRNINLLNMQPTVVLTDIYKCSSLNAVMKSTYQAQSIQEEPAQIEVIENKQKPLYSEDESNDHDEIIVSDKENKIDDQKFLEERKQSRRNSSKVSSYKEMKLNVKLRRC